jgi:hypothetical protein
MTDRMASPQQSKSPLWLRLVNGLAASRLLNGFFALFGLSCALLAGAEFVAAFADAGLAALLDVPLVFIWALGMWCAIASTANLVRSKPH